MIKILEQSENISHEYCCTVVKLGEIVPIEGSDFLGTAMVEGRTIVVRKDEVKEGNVMIYASNESQLNKDFLSMNNQFEDKELNVDKEKKGYFNKYGRIRMIKLRGQVSMGYLFDKNALVTYCPKCASLDLDSMVGEDFDTVDGELFVKAYVPPVKEVRHSGTGNKRNKKLKKFNRMIEGQFAFHYDTQQLQRNISRFNPEQTVVISTKVHGCVERSTIINTMEYGDIPIGKIVDEKINCHIKAFDTETKNNVYVPIDNYYTIPNDGEWYEIELENGKTILITGNNPVWVPDLNIYRRVDELKGDEFLLID